MTELTRRATLKGAAAASVALGSASALAACGGGSSKNATTTTKAGPPRRGGTLRVGLTGGTSADTWDPHFATNVTDFARSNGVFECLVGSDSSGAVVPVLAEEFSPNSDGTEWTARLRKGVEFHNGKEVTAEDVIYSFRRITNAKKPGLGAAAIGGLDASAMRKLDKYTVRMPCRGSFATLDQPMAGGVVVGQSNFGIVPVDFDPKHPIGTGPFKAGSLTPNRQFDVSRNPNYWRSGLPYLDKVVYTEYPEESSQVNALLSGQEDAVNLLSLDSISGLQSAGKQLLISDGAGFNPLCMRVDAPELSDVRVRQALRLVVDRPQLLELVYGKHGKVGNDIFGLISPEYDRSLPQRVQDIEQAKSLLKQAGRQDLRIELVAAPLAQGIVKTAQAFAQQASAAGITVSVRPLTVTEYYGPNYLKWPFSLDFWMGTYYLTVVGYSLTSASPFNETHWTDPGYTKLYKQAISTTDESKRADICHEMQSIEYKSGGYIIPFFPPVIDGHSTRVQGLKPTPSGLSLHDYNLSSVWLSA